MLNPLVAFLLSAPPPQAVQQVPALRRAMVVTAEAVPWGEMPEGPVEVVEEASKRLEPVAPPAPVLAPTRKVPPPRLMPAKVRSTRTPKRSAKS